MKIRTLSILSLAAIVWIIALPTVTAYYLNMWALTVVESSLVSTFVYLQPVMTVAMAMPILGREFHRWLSIRVRLRGLAIFSGKIGCSLAVTGGATGWLVYRRRLAEAATQRFLDLAEEMLCTIRVDGRLLRVNRAWEDLWGIRFEQVEGKQLHKQIILT